MSRDYINDPNEDMAWSLRSISQAVSEILEIIKDQSGRDQTKIEQAVRSLDAVATWSALGRPDEVAALKEALR